MMHKQPCEILCNLIITHGPGLSKDISRCKGLLRDYLTDYRQELNILILALQDDIPGYLLVNDGMPPAIRLANLSRRLQYDHSITAEAAEWAVETWAVALKVIPAASPPPPNDSLHQNHSPFYTVQASVETPALIIYVLDISASMGLLLGARRRIDIVRAALDVAIKQMIFRSTRGKRVSPRYKVAMFAYSDDVIDLLNGMITISALADAALPVLDTRNRSDTAGAFAAVERLLHRELPALKRCPAPLICHMTDGEFTGADPTPIVQRIMQMSVIDGPVLVENIFISQEVIAESVVDPLSWPGIRPTTPLLSRYAEQLRAMSSPLPASYRGTMNDAGYNLAPDAVMLLPGISPQLVEMGFVMSTMTGVIP
jgi:Mg-chelatase subunit ChlD